MPTSTVEDYVKAIFKLQQDSPTGEATVARIAATLGVTKGSVTAMTTKLREAELVRSRRYGGISLTESGRALALDVVRRHRIIEVFLVEKLGLDWSEVHEEAERLEHAISKRVLDKLDAFLGHPSIDPHGSPIPNADGVVTEQSLGSLSSLSVGESGVIARLWDRDSTFLAFSGEHGLTPGREVFVVGRTDAHLTIALEPGQQGSFDINTQWAEWIQLEGNIDAEV